MLPGPDDAVGPRHRAGAEGEGRDGLRAAHLETRASRPAATPCRRSPAPARGRGHADVRHARHLRRNHGHHAGWRAADSGPTGCRPPPYRAAARSARAASPAATRSIHSARQLQLRRRRGCCRRRSRRPRGTPASSARPRRCQLALAAPRTVLRVEAVELARVFEQRLVAALAHGFQNRPHRRFRLAEPRRAARQQPPAPVRNRGFGSCYITILFSGYSTMPCAPASLSRGMMSRTVDSSRMVFTASQSSSLRCEMVGLLQRRQHAQHGRRDRACCTFSISPTLPSALMAPSSSILMSSSLRRFQSSFQDRRVGDQLRVRFEHRVDDAQLVGAQRGAGLGHFDDGVGQHRRLHFGGAPTELHLGR